MTDARSVVLYGRSGCHLCDEARAVIQGVRAQVPFAFEEILIDGDEALERSYGERIPVVEVDGREAFELSVEPRRLRELLRA
jgi:hypothetical protein